MAVVALRRRRGGGRPRDPRRAGRERAGRGASLLIFTAVNLAIAALLALPYIPGNPRYLLFLMAALPVFLAEAPGRAAPAGSCSRP